MNAGYEKRRENLWKEFQLEVDGVKIKGRHHSFFMKSHGEPISGVIADYPKQQYKHVMEVNYAITLIEHKLRYKRKWSEPELYSYGSLYEYVISCRESGFKNVVLTSKEFAMIQQGPKPKKKG